MKENFLVEHEDLSPTLVAEDIAKNIKNGNIPKMDKDTLLNELNIVYSGEFNESALRFICELVLSLVD